MLRVLSRVLSLARILADERLNRYVELLGVRAAISIIGDEVVLSLRRKRSDSDPIEVLVSPGIIPTYTVTVHSCNGLRRILWSGTNAAAAAAAASVAIYCTNRRRWALPPVANVVEY